MVYSSNWVETKLAKLLLNLNRTGRALILLQIASVYPLEAPSVSPLAKRRLPDPFKLLLAAQHSLN
jgi:hypothetical protein